jgi:hypothetical protein
VASEAAAALEVAEVLEAEAARQEAVASQEAAALQAVSSLEERCRRWRRGAGVVTAATAPAAAPAVLREEEGPTRRHCYYTLSYDYLRQSTTIYCYLLLSTTNSRPTGSDPIGTTHTGTHESWSGTRAGQSQQGSGDEDARGVMQARRWHTMEASGTFGCGALRPQAEWRAPFE